jgi:plastocyanin
MINQTKKINCAGLVLIGLFLLSGCSDDSRSPDEDQAGHSHNGSIMTAHHTGTSKELDSHFRSSSHHGSGEAGTVPNDGRQITITATDFEFDPAEIVSEPGETLFITLINKGEAVHMWQIRDMPGTHLHAPPGESVSGKINSPEEPGEYEIYCGTAGHEELGMVGMLKIRSQ